MHLYLHGLMIEPLLRCIRLLLVYHTHFYYMIDETIFCITVK